MKGTLIYFIGFSLLFSACFKQQKFSSVPKISFDSFQITNDSATIQLQFQDGEGDIGLNEAEMQGAFEPSSKYYYNLYLVYYEKDDVLGWVVGKDLNGDTIQFKNRIKPIYTGKPKAIQGKIIVQLAPLYYNPFSSQSDTIKFRIQLIDRELHCSDWIESDEIIH